MTEIYKIPIIKGRKGVTFTAEHKRNLSEAHKKHFGTTNKNDSVQAFINETKETISIVANKFSRYAPKDDLIAETVTRLVYKFDQYNPELSSPKTFANMVAKQTMFWYCRPDTLNHNEYKILMRINNTISEHYQKTGEKLTVDGVAKLMKKQPSVIQKIMENGQKFLSLDKETFEDSTSLLGDALSTEDLGKNIDDYSDPEQIIIRSQMKPMLDGALEILTDAERQVILMSTGYESGVMENNLNISKKLGISNVYVGKILIKAKAKMRDYIANFEKEIEKSEQSNNVIKITLLYLEQIFKIIEKMNSTEEIKDLIKSINSAIEGKIQKSEDIRIRQRDPKIFDKKSMRTVSLSKSLGIKAVIGNLPTDSKLRVQTLVFNRDPQIGKSWDLKEAKEWTKANKERIKISIDVKELLQKIG